MFLELVKVTALLLALSLLQGFIARARFCHNNRYAAQGLSGTLFGCICIIGMMIPIVIAPGVLIDARSVVLSMAGLFGGPLAAALAATIAIAYRLFLGGDGMLAGIGVAITMPILGLTYRYCVKKSWIRINPVQLLIFGFAVHVIALLFVIALPTDAYQKAMQTSPMLIIITLTILTALLGMLLKDGENRFKTESALKESETKLAFHLHNTPLASISWNEDFICTQWNKSAETMFGYSSKEALGQHGSELIVANSIKEEVDTLFLKLMTQNKSSRNTNENITKDGRTIICEWYNTPITNIEGMPIGVSSLCEDITERKRSEKLIWKQANYDALTGLANREMLKDRLQQSIKKANRTHKNVALLYLDLDQFKDVNDTLGHHVGDALLVETAKRLTTYVRTIDTVARLGGDEFTIIMGELDSAEAVERVANEILLKLTEPFHFGNETAYISTSIGITLYPQDAKDSPEMLKNADQAMYAAKKMGRNCFQYFTTSMQEDALTRMNLVRDLRSALPNNEFQMYYQAIVELETGNILKAEALLRWHHPTRGIVNPEDFITVAEETSLIIGIGDWVFKEAARQSSLWRKDKYANFQISVNTSPVQYMHTDFNVNDWLQHLQNLGLPGDAVSVEITEGTLMRTESNITRILLLFRDAGIQVSLDDFGTGYSSMSYLKKLDIDYIKIDQLFVLNLEADSDDLALCEAIIVMAHKLGLKVIAEGIETKQQRDLLSAAGCDYGQGHFFSKALPAEEFELLLR
jgi:diguanylate cyclase (GGDEF)-like protein/PAS domain S-box-containing protein